LFPITVLFEGHGPALRILCPEAYCQGIQHTMVFQVCSAPRRLLGILSAEFAIGEQLRCQDRGNRIHGIQTHEENYLPSTMTPSGASSQVPQQNDTHYLLQQLLQLEFRNYYKLMDFPCNCLQYKRMILILKRWPVSSLQVRTIRSLARNLFLSHAQKPGIRQKIVDFKAGGVVLAMNEYGIILYFGA